MDEGGFYWHDHSALISEKKAYKAKANWQQKFFFFINEILLWSVHSETTGVVLLCTVCMLFLFLCPTYCAHTSNTTHIGGLPDEPLLCVEDVFDASDQLQRTAVIRALEDKEHMCQVRAC